jgi:aldehyde dehydrogenase (NAD+)
MRVYDKLYIKGTWVPSSGTGTLDVINAASEAVMGRVPEGTPIDVDRAVAAATTARETWAGTTPAIRAAALEQIAAGITARQEEIARTITGEVGMPIKLSRAIQAGLPATVTGNYAKLLGSFAFEEQIGNSLVVREPVGVVGCITPWNYPLHQVMAKVAPALAAGCTVVLKPSELAPLTAFFLAEIIDTIGLPPGVFNFVTGTGPVVGEALAAHPDVDMVSFTGSTRAGKRVSELAARTVKRVALELGGKSANIILDDADLQRAVSSGLNECYLNSGQTCSALTRMLVPRSRYDDAVALAKAAAERFTVGDPTSETTKLGPLISATQRERVRGYIRKGLDEGATLVTGGAEPPDGLDTGYYVRPTVFANVRNEMTIAQEEIFGPVLCIIAYDNDDDAVRLANDTIYGLSGAVWSADAARAKAVARRLRTGQVTINGGRYNPLAPFGGYKQSGHGRELGTFGLEEYLQVKALQL